MLKKIREGMTNFSAVFFPAAEEPAADRQPEDYFLIVEQARREWQDAKSRFEQIADPDLIDHAIYAIEATERRYIYLLKKAREESVHIHLGQMTGLKNNLEGKG